jgi:hypothetical protein
VKIFDPELGKTGRHREAQHGDDVEYKCPICGRKLIALYVNTTSPMGRCIKNHGKSYPITEVLRDGRSMLVVTGGGKS